MATFLQVGTFNLNSLFDEFDEYSYSTNNTSRICLKKGATITTTISNKYLLKQFGFVYGGILIETINYLKLNCIQQQITNVFVVNSLKWSSSLR